MKNRITILIIVFATIGLTGCATPIDHAAFYGFVPEVSAYLDKGGDVNARDDSYPHSSLLMRAASNGEVDMVKLLLERGADVRATDDWGETALHHAARISSVNTSVPEWQKDVSQYILVAQLLVAAGADPAARIRDGRQPIHYAAGAGSVELLNYFINTLHVSPNATDNYMRTPLHFAASHGYPKAIAFLGSQGANQNARNKSGETWRDRWAMYGEAEYKKRNASGSDGFLKAAVMLTNTALAASYDLPVEQQMQIISATAHDVYSDDNSGSELANMMQQNQAIATTHQPAAPGVNASSATAPAAQIQQDCSLAGNYEDNPSSPSSWASRITLNSGCTGGSYCVQTLNPDTDYVHPEKNVRNGQDYDWYCSDKRTIEGSYAFDIETWHRNGDQLTIITTAHRTITMKIDEFPHATCIQRMCRK